MLAKAPEKEIRGETARKGGTARMGPAITLTGAAAFGNKRVIISDNRRPTSADFLNFAAALSFIFR
jgi:hypothetical protein